MQVVILCGGQGTRLQEETQFRPKALVEIGGYPVLWHVMKIYASYGFNEFVLCLGYKGEMIKRYFIDYEMLRNDLRITTGPVKSVSVLGSREQEDWTITCADTGTDTPTGGRIHRIKPFIPNDDDTFMLTYCDSLGNIDIRNLLDFHHSSRKIATVTGVRPPSRFGELQMDGDMATGFTKGVPVKAGWIDGGFFVFNKRIFDYLDDQSWLSGDVRDLQDGSGAPTLQRLVNDEELSVYRHDGLWECMDTQREMEMLTEMWKTGQAAWRTWT